MKLSLILSVLAISATVTAVDLKATRQTCNGARGDTKSACGACCRQREGAAARKYIGEEAAVKIALAHAGLERAQVRDLQCELDRENGIMVYEVEFESGQYDYEYDIEATTGKVLKSKKELD